MDLEKVRRFLEGDTSDDKQKASVLEGFPLRFVDYFFMEGVRIDLIEPGRIVCSINVPPRLLNAGNYLHEGATAMLVDVVGSAAIFTVGAKLTGVSVEINVSYLDSALPHEEIEIDTKVLRVGKAIAVVSVEFRKKKTGKIIAQGRHTKYLAITSRI